MSDLSDCLFISDIVKLCQNLLTWKDKIDHFPVQYRRRQIWTIWDLPSSILHACNIGTILHFNFIFSSEEVLTQFYNIWNKQAIRHYLWNLKYITLQTRCSWTVLSTATTFVKKKQHAASPCVVFFLTHVVAFDSTVQLHLFCSAIYTISQVIC